MTADGGEGVIDLSGAWLVEPTGRNYQGFSGGLCFFYEKGQTTCTGAIDTSGRVALTAPRSGGFESGAGKSENGLYPFYTLADGRRRAEYMNRKEEFVIPTVYQMARPFCDGAAPVRVCSGNGIVGGVIDVNGGRIAAPGFQVGGFL